LLLGSLRDTLKGETYFVEPSRVEIAS